MGRDIISAEAELAIAVNQVTDYAQFLLDSIDAYIGILQTLQTDGIKDDLVCARLSEIAQTVEPVKTSVADCCEDVSSRVNQFIRAVAMADDFRFSSDLSGKVSAILAQLI